MTSKSGVESRLDELEEVDEDDGRNMNVTTEGVEVVGTDDEGRPVTKDGDTVEGGTNVTSDVVTVSVED